MPDHLELTRCDWAVDIPDAYQRYHDEEWGRPIRGDQPLFERICLEAFQAGLSWWSVLSRRDALRTAFVHFDPHVLAEWGEEEIAGALANPAIIRNRAKVRAVVHNARIVREFDQGELTDLIWSFQPTAQRVPEVMAELPAVTAESTALAAALKSRGLAFIGPTTAYALMQACGLVNDHLADCAFRTGTYP
jgi:DNA-3-methyladenine glycosylase I